METIVKQITSTGVVISKEDCQLLLSAFVPTKPEVMIEQIKMRCIDAIRFSERAQRNQNAPEEDRVNLNERDIPESVLNEIKDTLNRADLVLRMSAALNDAEKGEKYV